MEEHHEGPVYLTSEFPGIGGVIKTCPEDFFVEELPLYEASGSGAHVYAYIEKRGLGTREAVYRIGQALGTSPRSVGSAGLKDTHAVTRQWISIENADPDQVKRISMSDMRVLKVSQHTNKLKPGHLAGNRFVVRLRQTSVPMTEAARIAEQVLAILASKGVPNYYGPQRFGNRYDNHLLGKAVIDNDPTRVIDLFIGRPDPELDSALMFQARTFYLEGRYQEALDIWPRQIPERRRILKALVINRGSKNRAFHMMDKHLKGFFISAYQSFVFNRVLTARMPEIDKLLTGDMAYKHENGACFQVEDAATEQPRCERFEISPTGPLVGLRTTRLTGPAAAIEDPIFEAEGLGEGQFRQMKRLGARGGRRPLRFQPRNAGLSAGSDDLGEYLELRFELDAGCYATTLLAEISKTTPTNAALDQSPDEAD